MKAFWKKLTARLPRLPRKWRIVRNLGAVALMLAALPALLDFPALTADAAFRQAERQFLMTPSELVLRVGEGYLTCGEDWVTVGQVRRHSSMGPYQKYQGIINNVLPRDELAVVFIPGEVEGVYTAAAFGLPEGAASGALELTVSGVDSVVGGGWHLKEETFTARADRQGEWMFFAIAPHQHDGAMQTCILETLWWEFNWTGVGQWPYTLTLLDANGEPIQTVEGTLPVDRRFLQAN